ncbi:MAG: UvrB/UvrC motif-containing protein, partial [Pseudomonadota bacterium]|nr:UvrB/UvrC motif-containing protein [Pseudomonadota bacterium]
NGKAILYADKITKSMEKAIGETERRREKQIQHNLEHGITPQSLNKQVSDILDDSPYASKSTRSKQGKQAAESTADYNSEIQHLKPAELASRIKKLEKQMYNAAKGLDFEEAASLRDQIKQLKNGMVGVGDLR